jgi:C4-dicarboxylate-specific signal transduction histidine kinase
MRMASSSCIELCMRARRKRSLAVGLDAGVPVVVQDPGVRFERASLDQCFEPLYTTKPDGLDMGLSISRSIIVAHGGRLWATPNACPGATFQFILPAWKGQRP